MKNKVIISCMALCAVLSSCRIEPPLHLPAEDVLVDLPVVETNLEVVWQTDADFETEWYYGWDEDDIARWGDLSYPDPTSFEVRRYFLGDEKNAPHTTVDAMKIFQKRFRATFQFGYYDMLVWSDIDSPDGTQTLVVNEAIDTVTATTSITKGFIPSKNQATVVGLYNQPEIFYSTFPEDIFISRHFEDYDYYDEENHVYVKKIDATMHPLVYIYLVQVILHNNHGRVTGISGDASMSGMASTTNVNTGKSGATPGNVYFDMRMKKNLFKHEEPVDIIGGKFTTFGLCNLKPYFLADGPQYKGPSVDQKNNLYVDIAFANGADSTYMFPVRDQVQAKSYGGIITIDIDCNKLPVPHGPNAGRPSCFVPTVADYENVIYEFDL
jgi:hypothetical protein